MSFQKDFLAQLDEFSSSPFLFVGSGFSLRYLQSETWEGLLRKYSSAMGKQFERYRSEVSGDWPKVGSLIARDYHKYWFDSPELEAERNFNMQEITSISSPLKVSISAYLRGLIKNRPDLSSELREELELLATAKINGIITTNYDELCESIYKNFKVYKSQGELIFSALQEVGEIYKIHGCCTEPNTIVITEEDYINYNDRNAYLAAKLLAVFLEHPTIFIGYSISDTNVRTILTAIVKCLDQDQVNELSTRIFFVQYDELHQGEPILEKHDVEIGGNLLPLTRIKAKSYIEIFQVLNDLQQKFPASLMRKLKEHIYELVQTNDPTGKIAVTNIDSDTDIDKVEFVMGVGILTGKGEKSYETYSRIDIAEDILFDNQNFDITEITTKTLPKFSKNLWVPVCKYYQKMPEPTYASSRIISAAERSLNDWKSGNPYSYKSHAVNERFASIEEAIQTMSPDKAVQTILQLDIDKIEVNYLGDFLRQNFNVLKQGKISTYFMKLVCLYDRLKFGN